jgi:hypothetical protein
MFRAYSERELNAFVLVGHHSDALSVWPTLAVAVQRWQSRKRLGVKRLLALACPFRIDPFSRSDRSFAYHTLVEANPTSTAGSPRTPPIQPVCDREATRMSSGRANTRIAEIRASR